MLPLGAVQYCFKHSSTIAEKFCSVRLVSVDVVHPYRSFDTTAAWSKLHFLSMMFGSHMADRLSITVNAFASRVLKSFSVDETLLPR